MIKKMIFNSDDFGMCEGNTIGVLLAHKNGILTSATCMMNMPYAEFALNESKKFPDFGVGIHLVLTVGRPLLEGAKSFVDENGNFRRPKSYADGQPHADKDELYNEWKAQIEKFIKVAGHKPTHIDSHHHVHMLPWHIDIAKKLAQEYDIPMRQRDKVLDTYEYVKVDENFYEDGVTIECLKDILTNNNDEILEVMAHVALLDQELYDMSSYNLPRMKELQIITSDEMKQFIKDNNIELVHFGDVKKQVV